MDFHQNMPDTFYHGMKNEFHSLMVGARIVVNESGFFIGLKNNAPTQIDKVK